MQVAELLSDLTSLRPEVCVRPPFTRCLALQLTTTKDPKAALALVSARSDGQHAPSSAQDEQDPELKRAKDLLELHADVKLAHADGTDRELNEARQAVADVLAGL